MIAWEKRLQFNSLSVEAWWRSPRLGYKSIFPSRPGQIWLKSNILGQVGSQLDRGVATLVQSNLPFSA